MKNLTLRHQEFKSHCLHTCMLATDLGSLGGFLLSMGVGMDNEEILKTKRAWAKRKKEILDSINADRDVCPSELLRGFAYAFVASALLVGALVWFLFFGGCKHAYADVVSVASSQIGKGETWGDNRGKDVFKYTNGKAVPWCAAFVSWTLNKAGKNTPYLLSAKSYLSIGKRVSNPRAGDIIVLSRKSGGHVGIIKSVNKDTITTIEGNVGKFPARVKTIVYNRNNIKNLIAFVRV